MESGIINSVITFLDTQEDEVKGNAPSFFKLRLWTRYDLLTQLFANYDKLDEDYLIDVVEHLNKEKYPNQQFYVVDVDGYVYLVQFVREGNRIFLKTIYPSRKATKEYLNKKER